MGSDHALRRIPAGLARLLPLAPLALLACAGLAQAAPQAWLKFEAEPGIQVFVDRIQVEVNGPFAEKHIDVRVRNRSTVPLEATLKLPLAANERLRGYALDVNGLMRDAVAVDRVQARVAFEDAQRKRIDPALVEKDSGNSYRLRVFPVPAGGERRVRLDVAALAPRAACGWQHRIEGGGNSVDSRLRLDVSLGSATPPGRRAAGSLAWHAVGKGRYEAVTHLSGLQAAASFCLPAPAGLAAFQTGQAGQQFLFAELPAPQALSHPRKLPDSMELVWDSSLSMAGRAFERERQLITSYFSGRHVQVTLTLLRQGEPERRRFEIRNGDVSALLAVLAQEPADGATNLAAWKPDPSASENISTSAAEGTWPGAATVQPAVPVFVIDSTGALDPAAAAFLTRAGGRVIALTPMNAKAASQGLMTQGPRLLSEAGPLESAWQMPAAGPLDGTLRACRMTPTPEEATLTAHNALGERRLWPLAPARALPAPGAAFWCATWLADALAMDPDRYRAQLSRLGRDFGLVTGESSLIVLESAEDYARNQILPPQNEPGLRAEVQRRLDLALASKSSSERTHMARLRASWAERKGWWAREFPKDSPPAPKPEPPSAAPPPPMPMAMAAPTMAAPAPAAPPTEAARSAEAARRDSESREKRIGSSAAARPTPAAAAASITLMTLRANEPYTARLMEAATAADVYRNYLDLRGDYLQSPAFYLDVADRLYELRDAALAARVLSNIVELLPRQQAALRIVAYRLQQAGELAQALPLLERVRSLAPDEPQSLRDLGLAYGRLGACQAGIDALAQVALQAWPDRFADIDLVALAELNDQATRCDAKPDLSRLDPKLLADLPIGLRATLGWDLNDTDIDLWVIDPNGEQVNYTHRDSYQGGHLSRDFTAGYGPEEFILQHPKPGRYRIEVNYFGSRVAKLARGAVVQIQLQTGFGTAAMHGQALVLRLAEKSGRVLVGTFTVGEDGAMSAAEQP